MKNNQIENIVLAIFVLLTVDTFMLAVVIIDKPIILVEHKNQSCSNEPIDTSWNLSNFSICPEGYTYYPDNSAAIKCTYIKLKNGTEINTHSCINDLMFHYKCINSSLIEETIIK